MIKINPEYYGEYNKIPVCNTIKKILLGKVFYFYRPGAYFVIIGVRRNDLYGYLEILVGRLEYNKRYGFGREISVYSWYCYNRHDISFYGRDTRMKIRNCLKKNPSYIKYHLGMQLDADRFILYKKPSVYNYPENSILIYDKHGLYADYLNNKEV